MTVAIAQCEVILTLGWGGRVDGAFTVPGSSEDLAEGTARCAGARQPPSVRTASELGLRSHGRATGCVSGDPRPAILQNVTELRVSVSDEVADRLAAEAAQRGSSAEVLAAELLTAHAPLTPKGKRFGFVGIGHSGRHDLSERVEELLAADFDR